MTHKPHIESIDPDKAWAKLRELLTPDPTHEDPQVILRRLLDARRLFLSLAAEIAQRNYPTWAGARS